MADARLCVCPQVGFSGKAAIDRRRSGTGVRGGAGQQQQQRGANVCVLGAAHGAGGDVQMVLWLQKSYAFWTGWRHFTRKKWVAGEFAPEGVMGGKERCPERCETPWVPGRLGC